MKTPILKALFATTLVLGFSLPAYAEMVSEEVESDAITPEQELVIVKKKPARKAAKKVIIQEDAFEEPSMEQNQSNSQNATQVTSVAVSQTQAPRKGVGSVMDEAVDNKMSDVRSQFEQAIVKSLDRIKVNVDDGSAAVANANVTQTTTVVQDGLTATAAAPAAVPADTYIAIDRAPKISDKDYESDEDLADGTVVSRDEKKSANTVRISPIGGFTSLKSDAYNIDSRYTAGIGIEVDIDSNLSGVMSYTYSQYDVALANGGSFYNHYSPILNGGNLNKLEYNQNLFDAGLRFYLLPRESKFRAFIGSGLGYNKGYLNYKKNQGYGFNNYNYTNYGSSDDYEVTSFVGQIETGAEIQLSKMVAFGGLFKYSKILSSRENRPINNYGFVNNGYGYQAMDDKSLVGGSIAENDFYSILGTVKVSF